MRASTTSRSRRITPSLTHSPSNFRSYLPTYSPHLNIAEVLWRELKYEWLRAEDYAEAPTLHYQVWLALKAVGRSLRINFSPFRQSGGLNQT